MRITKISVKGLFGVFDHVIPLDHENRITIIHGPNGYGKTTILRLVDALFTRKRATLKSTPFSEMRVDFTNGATLRLKKVDHDETQLLEYKLKSPGERSRSFRESPADPREFRSFPLAYIEHEIPELERVGPRMWRDLRTADILDFDDVVTKYSHSLPPSFRQRLGVEFPEWLDQFLGEVSVRLVEAQRLLRIPDDATFSERRRRMVWSATVEAYAEELAGSIKTRLAESAALSQSLDRTFPQRLVESQRGDALEEEELLQKMNRIESHRSQLIDAGLLDPQREPPFQVRGELSDYERRVLSVWVKDVEKKLSIYDELARKIDLFRDILNEHFIFKEIEIDKELGFVFKTPDGSHIPPIYLSSGEQHELVLTYELLFKVGEGALVLIDEPELSLHVAWQLRFLKDLQAIVQLSPFDALIATHSPQIINERWDLTVQLEGPERND